MGNCCNKIEHYVVKPNTPVYDWPYEYSTGSNSKSNCCCNSEAMMVTIANLQGTLASLQDTIAKSSAGGVTPEQIENAVSNYLNATENATALKQLIDKEIKDILGISSSSDITELKSQVQSILDSIAELQPVINNISNIDVEELSQYGDSITQINADLSALESRIAALETSVGNFTNNLDGAIATAVETKLQDSDTLNSKITEAVNNNTTIAQMNRDLTSHIIDESKHFKSGDVHVTQEDITRWNNASSGSDWSFSVEDTVLNISK